MKVRSQRSTSQLDYLRPPGYVDPVCVHDLNLTRGPQLIALMLGYLQQDIRLTLWIGLGGTALAFFMVVPPWPAFNELPEKWLPVGSGISGPGIEVDGKKVN